VAVPGRRGFWGRLVNTETLGATEEDIASILRLRRARAEMFGAELFGDLAWDILLQLFAARLGRRKVRLSDLQIVAPKTTVARWAAVLEERGLISCHLDRLNSKELWIELSASGAARMSALFRSLRPARQ